MTAHHESSCELPTLIPREILFGEAERESPRISPDATKLAYLAPHCGKLSVWVCTIGACDDRVVAHDPARPIPWCAWQGDSQHVLYLQDHAGDENYHLFSVDLCGGSSHEMTPGENLRCLPLAIDARYPDVGLISLNSRDASLFDVYRVDFTTGLLSIDTENPGDVSLWLADHALVVRGAVAQLANGSSVIRVRDDRTSVWRTIDEFSLQDGAPQFVAFSPDNQAIIVRTAKTANADRLVKYDVLTGASTVLFEDAHYDVTSVFVDRATDEIVAVGVLRERLSWHTLDAKFEATFAALHNIREGDFAIINASSDGNTLLVCYRIDAGPDFFYLYNQQTSEATLLFCNRPALLDHKLATMEPISYIARDGLKIHGYLTLPVGVEPRNLPAVLVVHGGPWHRDSWGYDPVIQWLANRGYAVIQVNFRGSTGYGKDFLNAGNRQFAGAMRTDLLDARDWAIAQGYADPQRFAIFGGSYGGYAVLTALAFTPDAFTCGVDLVGPSNLNTFVAAIPPYWKQMRAMFAERIGDDAEFLASQSPLFRADAIRSPLLIAQGANDPRVKQQESDQMVEVLRKNTIPVTYVVFENEGHGFADPANSKRFTALAEAFLAQHLGGRLEPAHPHEDITEYLR